MCPPDNPLLTFLTSNSIFWLTVLGFALRRLRIDFRGLEDAMKSLYNRAEQFDFPAFVAWRATTLRLLALLFGSNNWGRAKIAVGFSLVFYGYAITVDHAEWIRMAGPDNCRDTTD
jgi:hypothetical protein